MGGEGTEDELSGGICGRYEGLGLKQEAGSFVVNEPHWRGTMDCSGWCPNIPGHACRTGCR